MDPCSFILVINICDEWKERREAPDTNNCETSRWFSTVTREKKGRCYFFPQKIQLSQLLGCGKWETPQNHERVLGKQPEQSVPMNTEYFFFLFLFLMLVTWFPVCCEICWFLNTAPVVNSIHDTLPVSKLSAMYFSPPPPPNLRFTTKSFWILSRPIFLAWRFLSIKL